MGDSLLSKEQTHAKEAVRSVLIIIYTAFSYIISRAHSLTLTCNLARGVETARVVLTDDPLIYRTENTW